MQIFGYFFSYSYTFYSIYWPNHMSLNKKTKYDVHSVVGRKFVFFNNKIAS